MCKLSMMYRKFGFVFCICLFVYAAANPENKAKLRAQKLPPCGACRLFVTAFKKRVDETARGKYEGGDTAWEESHQLDYQRSELRLIEIQEKLCEGIGKGEDQCIINAEELEPLVEQWWFHKQDVEPDLTKWLCIEELKLCCPAHHYGPNCTPCDGQPDNMCSNNGRCKGSGTRNGTGECICDKGYAGSVCSECAQGYYESYRDDAKLICSPCFAACEKTCTGPGPKGCSSCGSGWEHEPDLGCIDINECLEFTATCQEQQFCVNNEGSFSCLGAMVSIYITISEYMFGTELDAVISYLSGIFSFLGKSN
ncbi:hypothetical protein B566_EDAN007057 [Ephemera danica]|nr:hypothetical protein B566_EDAN007057 [Ephemera danica]